MLRASQMTFLVVIACTRFSFAADPSSEEAAAAFPPCDGLAVQVGVSDAGFLGSLTHDGKRLVHGLALDDTTRDKVRAGLITANLHPLASVSTWTGAPRLPYADRLVNLLILDRDSLQGKAPTIEECQRVVAPGGVILARVGGAWKKAEVTQLTGFADWTHFDGGADGNAVSKDSEATGLHGLQWIDNAREIRWEKTGPHGGDQGNIRILGRYAVIDMHIRPMDKDPKFQPRIFLECRDVNNGLLIWQKPRPADLSPKRWALAVGSGMCFTWLKDGGPLTAIDLASGIEVRTYPGSEPKPWMEVGRRDKKLTPANGFQGDNHWVRVIGNTVLANGNGPIQAWSLDGKPLWTFEENGNRFELPAVDEQRKVVYGLMIENKPVSEWGYGPMMWQRWPNSKCVKSIVALDLQTGQKKWENTEIASRDSGSQDWKTKEPILTEFGQLIAAGDFVVAANSNAIGGGHITVAASLDASTGKTLHFDPKSFNQGNGSINSYDAIYRDGMVYLMTPSDIYSFNPKTGEVKVDFSIPWNGRCAKPIATKDNFLVGQTAFLRKDFAGEMFSMARAGCANSPVPGAGLIIFGPHLCSCVTHFDGFFATTSRKAPAPVVEAQRLIPLNPTNVPVPPATKPRDSLITESWSWYTISAPVQAVKLEKDGWTFSIDPQAHRIDATAAGKTWSFISDARMGTAIAVVGKRVVVGSHDGWVYGLDLDTGNPLWRYLAAPAERLMLANGMLTSSWPVFGVADLGDGLVVASAGTHAELDGGIRIVALKAEDGCPAWIKNLSKKPTGHSTKRQRPRR